MSQQQVGGQSLTAVAEVEAAQLGDAVVGAQRQIGVATAQADTADPRLLKADLLLLAVLTETQQAEAAEYCIQLVDQAVDFVASKGLASISLIQRQFAIGYNKAAKIIEQMEAEGIIGPPEKAGKPRKVLVKSYAEMED